MYILPTLTYLEVGVPAGASGIICFEHFKWEPIFTKQLFPKHFERLRSRVLMGHENWDDMVQRVESVAQSGDNVDDPKLYVARTSGALGSPK